MSDIDMEDSLVRLFGKGSKERIVPFGRPCRDALSDYFDLGGRPALVPESWSSREDSDAVFLGVHGTRLSRQAIFNIVKNMQLWQKSKKFRHTLCGIRAQRTCWCMGQICALFKNCWVMHR